MWRGVDDVSRQGGVERSVVTIGNLDGVRRGHQQLAAGVVARAAETGALPVVVEPQVQPDTATAGSVMRWVQRGYPS